MKLVATQPICLHPDRENLVVGKRATIVGWGKLSHSIRQPVMQFLEVPLTAWEQCSRIYSSTGALESPKSVGMYAILLYGKTMIYFVFFNKKISQFLQRAIGYALVVKVGFHKS